MISRLAATLVLSVAAATPVLAHPGHVGAADGHAHWLGWALLGLAAISGALWVAAKYGSSFATRAARSPREGD